MHHTLKVKDLGKLGLAEAVMAVVQAREELKTAARRYAKAKLDEESPHVADPREVRVNDLNDDSQEGKALEQAALSYALWRDALVHVRARVRRQERR